MRPHVCTRCWIVYARFHGNLYSISECELQSEVEGRIPFMNATSSAFLLPATNCCSKRSCRADQRRSEIWVKSHCIKEMSHPSQGVTFSGILFRSGSRELADGALRELFFHRVQRKVYSAVSVRRSRGRPGGILSAELQPGTTQQVPKGLSYVLLSSSMLINSHHFAASIALHLNNTTKRVVVMTFRDILTRSTSTQRFSPLDDSQQYHYNGNRQQNVD
jgi:hypothetical protein